TYLVFYLGLYLLLDAIDQSSKIITFVTIVLFAVIVTGAFSKLAPVHYVSSEPPNINQLPTLGPAVTQYVPKYLEIKEWGVKIAVPPELGTMTYSYENNGYER